jgi:AcrR family transcriptional regulator
MNDHSVQFSPKREMEAALAGRKADKRNAILEATLDLVTTSGLHNTPMSAIARRAGVATGTLYLYFKSKEDLINELFLEQKRAAIRSLAAQVDPEAGLEARLRQQWFAIARRHLDHPRSFNFVQQCEASSVLTDRTLQLQWKIEAPLLRDLERAQEQGLIKALPVQVFYALAVGPVVILAHLQAKGEIEVTDATLELIYENVRRGLQP